MRHLVLLTILIAFTTCDMLSQNHYPTYGSAVLNGSIEDIEKGLIKDGFIVETIGKDGLQRLYKGLDQGIPISLILKQNENKEWTMLSTYAFFDEIKVAIKYMLTLMRNASNQYNGAIIDEYIYPEEPTDFPELSEYTYIIDLDKVFFFRYCISDRI